MTQVRILGTFKHEGSYRARDNKEIGYITAQIRLTVDGVDMLITDQELSKKLRKLLEDGKN